jgi:HEPN domain-containing protein
MFDEAEYLRWIGSAHKTLESAQRDHEDGDYNWACFKAHQAADKALKAILWGIGMPKTGHSLVHLLSHIAQELGVDVSGEVREACMALSKFYTITRHPDAWSEGMPEEYFSARESEEALRHAKMILDWVEGLWRKLSGKG